MNRTLFSVLTILLALSGCAPETEPSTKDTGSPVVQTGDGGHLQTVQESGNSPGNSEVSAEKIMRDIVGRVVLVSESTGAGPETEWTFDADEFRKVNILEKRLTEKGLSLVIFMNTGSNPKQDEEPIVVSGKLLLEYEKRADQWFLKTIGNLSFSYSLGISS